VEELRPAAVAVESSRFHTVGLFISQEDHMCEIPSHLCSNIWHFTEPWRCVPVSSYECSRALVSIVSGQQWRGEEQLNNVQ